MSATEPGDVPIGPGMHPSNNPIPTTKKIWHPAMTARTEAGAKHDMPLGGQQVKLSILMSAYNEEHTIAQAIHEILVTEYPCDYELIVVDDGSTDETAILLTQLNYDRLIVHRHEENRGKGAALLSAASLATGTHILPFDADLEYAAEDIPRILAPVIKGRCSVVYGVRLFGYNTVYQSLRYAVGNRLLTRMTNLLFDACLSDLHTCLKLVPLAMLRALKLTEEGFGLDTEITALLLKRGVRPFEVPVSYYSRSHAQGKKIRWRDALVCAWVLLRVRLQRWSRSQPAGDSAGIECRHSSTVIPQSDSQCPSHIRTLEINDTADEVAAGSAG